MQLVYIILDWNMLLILSSFKEKEVFSLGHVIRCLCYFFSDPVDCL
jgi:uncharacterized protein (UPF0303 family)